MRPSGVLPSPHMLPWATGVEEVQDDEGLLDQAVVGGAFAFLRRCVQTPHFQDEVGSNFVQYFSIFSTIFFSAVF